MQIKIKCPNKDCGKTLIVDSEMAGKKGKCSTCNSVFLIPGTSSAKSKPGGGSTVDLPTSQSGRQSGPRKKPSKSGTHQQKSSKRRPGSKSGEAKKSSEKFLDDYVEDPKPKKRRARREELDDFSLSEDDYVDYADDDAPPRRSGGRSRRRPERPPGSRDDFYDDYDDYEDYEDYEDDYVDYGPPDEYDDPYVDDYYEDPYDPPVAGGRSRRRKKSGPNVGLIRAGLMIMAIAGFVFMGALAIKILVELIAILSSDFLELIAMLASDYGGTSGTFWKIGELLWLGAAIAVIVGYSFLLLMPNKNNSMGLTIAALSVGSVNILVQIVFKIVPLFSGGSGFTMLRRLGIGSSSLIEFLLKIGFMEGLFIAEIVLVALALMAVNKQLKDRYNMQSAKQMIIPAGIYGGIMIVMGMFFLILNETKPLSPTAAEIWKWVLYLLRVGSQGMLIWYFISYVLLMFNTRGAMPRS